MGGGGGVQANPMNPLWYELDAYIIDQCMISWYLLLQQVGKAQASLQVYTPQRHWWICTGSLGVSFLNIARNTKVSWTGSYISLYIGESFQEYSWFQDFEADFPQKVSIKMLN